MKYLVMECFDTYSVVLDNEGRFIKCANLNYEVGQKTDYIFELKEENIPYDYEIQEPPSPTRKTGKRSLPRKAIISLLGIAACLLLIVNTLFTQQSKTAGSLYVKINPEVRIDVNRSKRVIDLVGINSDGKDLVEGYEFEKRDLDRVIDDLIARAIEKGYLYDQGQVRLKLDSQDQTWKEETLREIDGHIRSYLEENIKIEIKLTTDERLYSEERIKIQEDNKQIIIPLEKSTQEDSDYDDSEYGPIINEPGPTQKIDDDTDYDVEERVQKDLTDYDERRDTNYENQSSESDSDDDD